MTAGSLTLVAKANKPTKTNHKMSRYKTCYTRKNKSGKKVRLPSRQGISSIYPAKKFIKMEYEETGGLSSGTTISNFGTSIDWNLSDIRTVRTSASKRPQGYDQMEEIYHSYKVYGVKVDLTYTDPSQDGLYVGHRIHSTVDTDSLTGESLGTASMKRWTTSKPINDSGSQVVHYSRWLDISAIEGLTKNQFNSDITNYNASFATTGGPNKSPYLEHAIVNTKNGSNATVNYKIKLTYYVQVYDRKVLPTSLV